MPPPLPPHLITSILSHLLPPQPPLPPTLLATPLLDRLKFLPPDEGDIDAWLSPFSRSSSASTAFGPDSGNGGRNPLSERLERLSVHHILGEVLYAHDGESVLAKVPLRLDAEGDYRNDHDNDNGNDIDGAREDTSQAGESGIDVMFAFETFDQNRGWVYHSSQFPKAHGTDGLEWASDPDLAKPHNAYTSGQGPEAGEGGGEGGEAPEGGISAEEYWKDFTPPTPKSELPINEEDVEDAYWASYGGGAVSGGVTPARNRSMANLERLKGESGLGDTDGAGQGQGQGQGLADEGTKGEVEGEMTGGGRVMCDLPTVGKMLDPLAALLSTIPDDADVDEGEDEARGSGSPSRAASREAADLRDKVLGRIQSSLRDVWAGYTSQADANPESMEERALGWLRIAREVIDDTAKTGNGHGHGNGLVNGHGGEDEVMVRAKMEVLRDLYVVVAPVGEEDGFWRCVERAITVPMRPGAGEEGMTQETYWE